MPGAERGRRAEHVCETKRGRAQGGRRARSAGLAQRVRLRCYHHRVNSLTREAIVKALGLLADRLQPDEPRVDLIIVGGAAMVLLFGARDSTKDVDAFHVDLEAKSRVAEAAASVATALDLPSDWLNDGAKGYVHGLSLGPVLLDTPTLRVRTLSPMQLLAMKLSAWRDDLESTTPGGF